MKVTYRIPTEQYAYVEIEEETLIDDPQRIQENFKKLSDAFKPQVGLTSKEFNACVDEMLNTGTVKEGTELYQRMNDKQKFFFQEHKKGLNRLEAKK